MYKYLPDIWALCVQITYLDGLARLIPAGATDLNLKLMGRTIEAFMSVTNSSDSPDFQSKSLANPGLLALQTGQLVKGLSQPLFRLSSRSEDDQTVVCMYVLTTQLCVVLCSGWSFCSGFNCNYRFVTTHLTYIRFVDIAHVGGCG